MSKLSPGQMTAATPALLVELKARIPRLFWRDLPTAVAEADGLGVTIIIISDNATEEIRLTAAGVAVGREYTITCLAVQDRLGTSGLKKTFYVRGVLPPVDYAQYAIAGGGTLGGVLLLCLTVFCIALWVMKDRWRNLSDEEIYEFFKGNGSDGEGCRPASAWDLPYDVEKEIAKEELRIGKYGREG